MKTILNALGYRGAEHFYTFYDQEHSACEELDECGTHRDIVVFADAHRNLMRRAKELIQEGVCASVYTQGSDVEEVNGVYTNDREVRKIWLYRQ